MVSVIIKHVGDQEEGSISLDGENDIQRRHAVLTKVTTTTATDRMSLDSFGDAKEVDHNPDAFADEGFDLDKSFSLKEAVLHSSRKSSRSFDISGSYGDDTAITNSKNKNRPLATQQQTCVKCLFFCLLIVAAILSILSATNFHVKICGFATFVAIGAIGIVFVIYDYRMKKHEELLIKSITRSEAIVNSLFPEIVRDRILEEGMMSTRLATSTFFSTSLEMKSGSSNFLPKATTTPCRKISEDENCNDESCNTISSKNIDDPIQGNIREKTILASITPRSSIASTTQRRASNHSTDSGTNTIFSDGFGISEVHQQKPGNVIPSRSSHSASATKPIADYFPSATIMFADIVGFTSWASIRDPAQVFELLETLYRRFDRIAKKKGVFKVETIGDCYVAATGLPNAMNDHAVAMASFARRCLECMLHTVAHLEESLGPGTADLGLRIGIHSGSVIGGVLRGAKSRYQLFGDTMNTASRIESSSSKNRIHLSEQTAELIIEAGKKPWVELRRNKVLAKGKGELKTFWLTTDGPKNLSAKEKQALPAILKMMANADIDPGFIKKNRVLDKNEKRERLVDYHTNVLKGLMNKLAAMNFARTVDASDTKECAEAVDKLVNTYRDFSAAKTFTEEVMEEITFPTPTKEANLASTLAEYSDPYTYVIDDTVSNQLRDLVSRISKWHRDDLPFHTFDHASHTVLSITKLLAAAEMNLETTDTLLNTTKSMITHPLTQFVLVFAALVHNICNENTQDTRLVAAEKSVNRVWSLFLEPSFRDLRQTLCRTKRDYEFFRRLLGKSIVVVTVKTTDLIIQTERMSDVPPPSEKIASAADKEASLKALSIVEKLLRASDVAYALQHFLVFQKWNKLLFEESYGIYKSEANDNKNIKEDPSTNWYNNELESFDERIRLIRALRDFGVCKKVADIYLNAAVANRREWEQKGKSIVEGYVSNLHHSKGKGHMSNACRRRHSMGPGSY